MPEIAGRLGAPGFRLRQPNGFSDRPAGPGRPAAAEVRLSESRDLEKAARFARDFLAAGRRAAAPAHRAALRAGLRPAPRRPAPLACAVAATRAAWARRRGRLPVSATGGRLR